MRDNTKTMPFKKSVDIEKIKEYLRDDLKLANDFLKIITKIDNREPITDNEFEFLELNSVKLQMKCNRYDLGTGVFHRPFGLEAHPNFQFIANFPAMFKDPNGRNDARKMISAIKSAISTYIQITNEQLNEKDLRDLKKNYSKSQRKIKRFNLDKKTIVSLMFAVLYLYSLTLLLNKDYFFIGFTINIIAVCIIVIISLINESNE